MLKKPFFASGLIRKKIILDSSSICVPCHSPKQSRWPRESPQTDQAGSGAHPSDWRGSLPHQTSEKALLTEQRTAVTKEGRKGLWRKEHLRSPPHVFTSLCLNLIFLSSVYNNNDHLPSLSNALHALSHLIPKTTL